MLRGPTQYQGSVAPSDYAREDGCFYDDKDWEKLCQAVPTYDYNKDNVVIRVFNESWKHTRDTVLVEKAIDAALKSGVVNSYTE
jgi:hypothetical protein